jgi:NADPH-dependent 2,4-dienoyl-CoA reductase/sulfur reductase-like enzyme
VDENHFSSAGKHDVGFAGKVFSVKAEPIAEAVQRPPYNSFWACVFAPNGLHDAASLFSGARIDHSVTITYRLVETHTA